MPDLLSRITQVGTSGLKPQTEIYYNGLWFTFSELVKEKEFIDLNLHQDTIGARWKKGDKDIKTLMRPARNYKKRRPVKVDDWLFEGCTPEQIVALKSENNKELLSL